MRRPGKRAAGSVFQPSARGAGRPHAQQLVRASKRTLRRTAAERTAGKHIWIRAAFGIGKHCRAAGHPGACRCAAYPAPGEQTRFPAHCRRAACRKTSTDTGGLRDRKTLPGCGASGSAGSGQAVSCTRCQAKRRALRYIAGRPFHRRTYMYERGAWFGRTRKAPLPLERAGHQDG